MGVLKKFRLRDNERVIYIIRHWFGLLVPNLAICFLIIVLDFFLMYYLFMRGVMGVIVFLGILLIVAAYLGRLIFLWRRNVLIITNQRLIDWEQTGFFNQMLQEITFNEIEQIHGQGNGFWGKLLKFGNLIIKIEQEKIPLELYNVKDPIAVLGILKKHTEVPVSIGKVAMPKDAEENKAINAETLQAEQALEEPFKEEYAEDSDDHDNEKARNWQEVLEELKELELNAKKLLYREFKEHLKEELQKTLE